MVHILCVGHFVIRAKHLLELKGQVIWDLSLSGRYLPQSARITTNQNRKRHMSCPYMNTMHGTKKTPIVCMTAFYTRLQYLTLFRAPSVAYMNLSLRMAGDDACMAGDDACMAGDGASYGRRLLLGWWYSAGSIHRCVHTHSHLYDHIYMAMWPS